MQIKGFQKTTLLDYPDQVASLVFTGGCNFRCPYCHNSELVLHPNHFPTLMEEVVLDHLRKRKGIIDGLVITGGEPTLMKGLMPFMERVKEEGVLIKLDTNGYMPEVVKEVIQKGVVDFVAMDVKATYETYPEVVGVSPFDVKKIQASIETIIDSATPHEFRTTVMKEFHNYDDVVQISTYLKGAQRFVLQQYMESEEQLVKKAFGAYARDEMTVMKELVEAQGTVKEVVVRSKY